MNPLEVAVEREEDIPVFSPQGRLDAFGAKKLDEILKENINEGDVVAVIDMKDVSYLSSGGIRTFLATDRMLKQRDGFLCLCNITEYPLKVLAMAGFDNLFRIYPNREEAIKQCQPKLCIRDAQAAPEFYERDDVKYTIYPISKEKPALKIAGDITRVLYSTLVEEDIISRKFSETEYSIGLGALGGCAGDCMEFFGEMITVGGTMVWLPTDGNNTADFFTPRKDTGEVTIYTGFNVSLEGGFNDIVYLETPEKISFADLYTSLFEFAKENRPEFRGIITLAVLADISEVYSSGVQISPINRFRPENRKMIMDETNIRKWMALTSEPEYSGETLIAFGAGVDLTTDLSGFDEKALNSAFYLHPANTGGKKLMLHNHGVIFRHQNSGKKIDLNEEIKKTVQNGEFLNMRHLLDNTSVTKAVVGVSYISEILFEDELGIDLTEECPRWNESFESVTRKLLSDSLEVQLRPLTGGYSDSLVFRVNAVDRRGRKEMPFVLKMDEWRFINDEIKGYEDHVKRYIQNNATQVIQHCKVGDYGGILYNFVGIKGGDSEITDLWSYYFTHTLEEILPLFDKLFRVVLKAWYGQPRLKEMRLYEEYGSVDYFMGVKKYAEETCNVSADQESINLPYGLGESVNPLYFIKEVVPEKKSLTSTVYEASIHGDLNMRNILLDEDQNMWLIDFSRTKYSHILQDIAKLESVLKFEAAGVDSTEKLGRVLELEKIFLDAGSLQDIPRIPAGIDDAGVLKAFGCVQKLRHYANVVTQLDEDVSQYLLALLYYTLPVLDYVSVSDYDKEYAWISASLLCRKLTHL